MATSPHFTRVMGKAWINAIPPGVILGIIVLLYLFFSWLQPIIGVNPWFEEWLGIHSPLVIFINNVGLNLLAVIIDISILTTLAWTTKPKGLIARVTSSSSITIARPYNLKDHWNYY